MSAVFEVVWRTIYGVPLLVELMKTLASLAVAGGLYAVLAVASGLFKAFPMALLGVLLVVAASLARVALASTDRSLFIVGVGTLAVATNVGAAFLAGAI